VLSNTNDTFDSMTFFSSFFCMLFIKRIETEQTTIFIESYIHNMFAISNKLVRFRRRM